MELVGKIFFDFFSTLINAKLILIVFLFIYYNNILKKRNNEQFKILGFILPVIFIKEIIFSLLISLKNVIQIDISVIDFILYLSEIAIIIILLLWVRLFSGKKVYDFAFYGINIFFILFSLANFNLNFLPILNESYFLISRTLVVLSLIYFIAVSYSITLYNTENPENIFKIRISLNTLLIIVNILFIIPAIIGIHYDNIIIQNIFVPFSYLIPFLLYYQLDKIIYEDDNKKMTFLQNNLGALFDFMKKLGTAISEKLDLSQIMNMVIESAVKSTGAHGGAILLIDSFEDILKVEAVSGVFPPPFQVPEIVKDRDSNMLNYFKSKTIKLGETILGETAKSGESIFIKNTETDQRMIFNTKDDVMFISSIITIPLIVSKRILGVIAIVRRNSQELFDDNDFEHIKTFADYASLTIDFVMTYQELIEKREMERELGIAAEIQRKLLPSKLPVFKGLSLSAYTLPAKGVSGDYYDIIQLNDNKIAFVICDVAGKGVPASLVMVMIRTILRLICSSERDAMATVTWINRGISGSIEMDHFATLGFFIYDTVTREVTYSNAAHHPLIVYHNETKTIEKMDTDGLPIGIEKTAKYGQKKFTLAEGDMIMLYTDGIVEAMNSKGEQFTYESLEKIFLENTNLLPKELIDKINENIKTFVGNAGQHDDQTMLIMKV